MREHTTRATLSTCMCCGKGIGSGDYCGTCNKEIDRMKKQKLSREEGYERRFKFVEFEIMEDMIHEDVGGLTPGSQFTREDMVQMLKDKILAKNTLVKHIPTGDIYHVDYGR